MNWKKSLAALLRLPLNTRSHTELEETASQFKLVYGLWHSQFILRHTSLLVLGPICFSNICSHELKYLQPDEAKNAN